MADRDEAFLNALVGLKEEAAHAINLMRSQSVPRGRLDRVHALRMIEKAGDLEKALKDVEARQREWNAA